MNSLHLKSLNLTADGINHTIQGEGKFCGLPSIFIRLSGCNLRCQWKNSDGGVTLCDTPFSSHFPENNLVSLRKIYEQCEKSTINNIVITGGEPFLQKNTDLLVESLRLLGKHITIETNGTIFRPTMASFISISPKLYSSTTVTDKMYKIHNRIRINLSSLGEFVSKYPHQLKFVVNSPDDILEIEDLLRSIKEQRPMHFDSEIFLMPQGVTASQLDEKLTWIIQEAIKRNWRVSDRLQIRLWGDKRGV